MRISDMLASAAILATPFVTLWLGWKIINWGDGKWK